MLILSPEEIRNAEDIANKNGLSYEDMMESAGMGCAEHILTHYPTLNNIAILCGKGKNGGDGFVIARYLKKAGKTVNIIACFSSPSDELSEKNRQRIDGIVNIYDGSHVTKKVISLLTEADIIVDAVFGIGFKGELPENISEIFSLCKNTKSVKIAIDIPSGLTTAKFLPCDCFVADETLSMLCFKKEHIYKPCSALCGKVTVISIGFAYFGDGINAKSREEIKEMLPRRPFDSNKGSFGKALITGGCYTMPGAPVIATKGALSTGAGLTALAFPDCIYSAVTSRLSENIFIPLPCNEAGDIARRAIPELLGKLDSFNAVAIGPGLSVTPDTAALVEAVIKSCRNKLIIDADGINIVSRNINILKESDADILLTPHPAEMARLTGKTTEEINSSRIETAVSFARENGVTVLLKGANTVIASPDGKVFINPTGTTALSRGGSGDLLTGIAASFAAQGLSAFDSAVIAAYIHGLAGEIAEKKYTAYGASIEKITDCIPDALSEIIQGK